MSLFADPTIGAPFPLVKDWEDLAARTEVIVNSLLTPTHHTNVQQTTPKKQKELPPAVLMTNKILREFGHQTINDEVELQHVIINKLILETEHPDPKVRLRALELLGKTGQVGLFSERKDVVVTHQTLDEAKESLRKKLEHRLQRLKEKEVSSNALEMQTGLRIRNTTIEDAEFAEIDAAEELGVSNTGKNV